MYDFDLQKKLCLEKLYKPDKSRKGNVDEQIIPLINYINSLKNYYTTSSCSGRIYILTEANKKPEVKWLFVSHDPVTFDRVLINLKELPKERVWFRQENMILHVACRSIDDANKLLKIARESGFRRSGIIADSNIIITEICSTEKIDVPIAHENKLLVDEKYIKFIVDIANEKFAKGRKKMNLFFNKIKESFNNS